MSRAKKGERGEEREDSIELSTSLSRKIPRCRRDDGKKRGTVKAKVAEPDEVEEKAKESRKEMHRQQLRNDPSSIDFTLSCNRSKQSVLALSDIE